MRSAAHTRLPLAAAAVVLVLLGAEYAAAHLLGDRDGRISSPLLGAAFNLAIFASIVVGSSGVLLAGGRRRGHPRLANAVTACAAAAVVVGCVEAVSHVLLLRSAAGVDRGHPKGYHRAHDLLGYAPPASSVNASTLRVSGRTVYDVVYDVDEHQRRRTPVSGADGRRAFALFFGCSFTFGEGVPGDETLPYHFGERSRTHRPHNYGFHGYGPNQMLARLRETPIRDEVPERSGDAFYVYLADEHERRAIGSKVVYNQWARNTPYYRVDARGDLVRAGSFRTGRRLVSRLYELADRSAFLKHFEIDIPPRLRESHYELTARIIAGARDEFHRQFPGSRFHVVIYPTRRELRILPHLRAAGIAYLDYSGLFDPRDPRYRIDPRDEHPTREAHRVIAERLAGDLGRMPRTRR